MRRGGSRREKEVGKLVDKYMDGICKVVTNCISI